MSVIAFSEVCESFQFYGIIKPGGGFENSLNLAVGVRSKDNLEDCALRLCSLANTGCGLILCIFI